MGSVHHTNKPDFFFPSLKAPGCQPTHSFPHQPWRSQAPSTGKRRVTAQSNLHVTWSSGLYTIVTYQAFMKKEELKTNISVADNLPTGSQVLNWITTVIFFLNSKQLYFKKLSILLSIIKKTKQNKTEEINEYNFLEKRSEDVLHKLHYLSGYFINEINY